MKMLRPSPGAPSSWAVSISSSLLSFRNRSMLAWMFSRSMHDAYALSATALFSWVIFSEPTARATSYMPARTPMTHMCNAVLAPAQAFSTFTTGMDPMPMERITHWPRMECWFVYMPQKVLEK